MRVPSSISFLPAPVLRTILALILCAVCAGQAFAASMPNSTQRVSLIAREQPVGQFLQNLFASVGVPANISPDVSGYINGGFKGRARKVLADIARVYNLVTYYDGSVMHVVPAASLQRKTWAVSPQTADRMARIVAELDLTDAHNRLRRTTNGSMQAFGTRRFIEQIDDLFQANEARSRLPVPETAADFRVFYLRYAWAQDMTMNIGGRQIVVPGVASILRSVVGAGGGSKTLGSERMLPATRPSLRGQGLAARGEHARAGQFNGARGNDQSKTVDLLVNALARTAQPAPAPVQIQPNAQQVLIEADPRLNAIIVRDRADRLARYEQLINALDVEPQSVEIEATIIDINTDRMRELGIDWRAQRNNKSLSFNSGIPTSGTGGIASMVVGSATRFFARIRALQSEGAARVVSSPQVVTLSNVEAIFDNSSTFYVRVAGREDVDLFNVSAGTSLRVTPNVFRDRNATRIKLMVNVEDGNLTGRQVDNIPVVERSSINTQALIQEGQSLLIGGMVRDTAATTTDKVPGLGDVPVIGGLFRNNDKVNSRVERMFLITPRIANSGLGAPTEASQSIRQTTAPVPTPLAPTESQPQQVATVQVGGPAQRPRPKVGGAARQTQTPAVVRQVVQRRSSRVVNLNAMKPATAAPSRTPAYRLPAGRRTAANDNTLYGG